MTATEDRPPVLVGASKKVPGRKWRQQILRLVLWAGAFIAALVFVVVLTARSERAHEQLRVFLVEDLTSRLGREVSLRRVEYDFLPPLLELYDFEVAGPRPADAAVFEVQRLRLEAGLLDFWRRSWKLRQVEAYGPRLNLELDEEGRLNLPNLASTGSGSQIEVGVVVVERGEFTFDQLRISFNVAAKNFRSRLVGEGPGSMTGQITAEAVELILPGAQPYEVDLVLNGRLSPGRVDLLSGRLRGRDLEADFQGVILAAKGEAPEVTLDLVAKGRGEVFSHLGYLSGEVEGPLRTTGVLEWRQQRWSYRGGLKAPRMKCFDLALSDLSGAVDLEDQSLRIEIEGGSFAGGQIAGWIEAEFGATNTPVEVDLEFHQLEVDRLLQEQGIPIQGIASRVDGDLTYRSTQPERRRGTGWGQLFLWPEDREGIPWVGDIPFTIDEGKLSSSAVLLTSENHRVLASGALDLVTGTGRVDFEATTKEAGELASLLLPYLGGQADAAWVPLKGRGSLEGNLSLPSRGVVVAEVQLDLTEVVSSELKVDRLRGSFRADGGGVDPLNIEMSRAGGALLATGEVHYGGDVPGGTEIALDFDAVDWPLEEVASWQELGIPLAGAISGRLSLAGPGETLGGSFRGSVAPASFRGVDIDSLGGQLSWTPEWVEITRLEVAAPAGVVEAAGTYGLENGELDFRLSAAELSLGELPLSSLFADHLEGRMVVEGKVGGTSLDPRAEARIEFSHLAVAGRGIPGTGSESGEGSSQLLLSWAAGEVEVEGSVLGLLDLRGGGMLKDGRFDLGFDLESSRLRALAELAAGRSLVGLEGSFNGDLRASGVLGASPSLESTLSLDHLAADYRSFSLEAAEPVRFSWREGELSLKSLYLKDPRSETELVANGILTFEADHPIDLRVQSTVDLGSVLPFLEGFEWPEGIQLSGRGDLLGTIVGPLAKARFDGQAAVVIDPFVLPYLSQPVEGLAAQFSFYPDRLELEHLEAVTGEGRLRVRGTLDLGVGTPWQNYRLYAEAKGLKVLFPDGWLQEGDAELWLRSSETGRDLQGTVSLEQVRYLEDLEVNFAQAVERILAREREEVGSTNEWLTATEVEVNIRAPNALRVNNRAANLRGDLDLDLRGSLARPVLLGKVDLHPGGTLRYADNEYRLERGLVTFSNPHVTEPIIDLVASSRVRRYEVSLALEGSLDRLSFDVTSDPPLPQLDVMALVAGGRTLDPSARPVRPGSREEGQLEAQAFLYGQAASAITERVNTLFGFDKFRVDPLSQGSGSVSSVRLTVGKRLSKDLFVTYSSDPSSTQGDILEAEWQVGPQLVLVFTQNGDGSFSVDALWDRRF